MHWIHLAAAILLEVSGTTCMKLSEGWTRGAFTALTVMFYVGSFAFLGLALKTLDVSVAYAIWAGVGTALIAVIGFVWFQESLTPAKLFFIALIIVGVAGLNASGAGEQ